MHSHTARNKSIILNGKREGIDTHSSKKKISQRDRKSFLQQKTTQVFFLLGGNEEKWMFERLCKGKQCSLHSHARVIDFIQSYFTVTIYLSRMQLIFPPPLTQHLMSFLFLLSPWMPCWLLIQSHWLKICQRRWHLHLLQ